MQPQDYLREEDTMTAKRHRASLLEKAMPFFHEENEKRRAETQAVLRPLQLLGTDGGEWVIARKDRHGKNRTVAHVYSEQDAALIVQAVNTHERAKDAIDSLINQLETLAEAGACEYAKLQDVRGTKAFLAAKALLADMEGDPVEAAR